MEPRNNTTRAPVKKDTIWNGLILSVWIALSAFAVGRYLEISFISPMILAIILGILFRTLIRIPHQCVKGIQFAQNILLKIAIIFLGLQLSFTQIMEVGLDGLLAIVLTMASTFMFCLWVGKILGLDPKLSRLIASGTSICGASAIVATNSVVKGKDEHVAYSIAVVTLFGFLSMLCFPLMGQFFGLNPSIFGFWSGVSIHETAQVVAAAFQGGEESGEVGTVTKLSRVMFLIPVMILLSIGSKNSAPGDDKPTKRRFPLPWFVLGFVALVTINTFYPLNPEMNAHAKTGTKFMFIVALGAMGLKTDFSKLKQAGIKPLFLGAMSWAYVSLTGLLLAAFFLSGGLDKIRNFMTLLLNQWFE